MKRLGAYVSVLAAAGLLIYAGSRSLAPAQAPDGEDYLSPGLRERVELLKADFTRQSTNRDNLRERADVLWEWINAYSLTGGPVPVNATQAFTTVFEAADDLDRGADPAGVNRLAGNLDLLIREFRLKDEQPGAVGKVTLSSRGPFPAGSWQTLEQTYTVGEMPMVAGGSVVVARQLLSDAASFQRADPSGDNYFSLRCSNPGARFSKISVPWAGMHGGFRGAIPIPAFRLDEGILREGDTITIVYGDRSGGGRGWRQQSFQNGEVLLPIYIDLEGKGLYLTPAWPSFAVHGNEASAVRGFAPSVVKTGEPFEVAVRSEDSQYNRATGPIPEYEVTLNGKPFRTIPAGSDGITILKEISLDRPGVYRFGIRSRDGGISGSSNPVWVRDDPPYRIYWGEMHAHSGLSEGQGSVDTLYRYARDDARLDFLGYSEHDIWIDDSEWLRMSNAVRQYTEQGKFIAYLAYEWTRSRASGGHHNVFFRSPDHNRVPTQRAYDLSLLYQKLREENHTDDVLIVPHAHQAGDWRMNDPDMERLVEIMSMHGTFEWFGNYYLKRGFQTGFIAASDDHRSRPGYTGTVTSNLAQFGGLAAVLAPEKTTGAIFDALRNRSAYAVTSAERIIVDVTLNGGMMGQRIPSSEERRLKCRVMGTAPIGELAVIKNGEVIFTKRPLAAPLRSRSAVQIGFESSSEPFVRDNPRPYRRWRGTLEVIGAKLAGLETLNFDNRYLESASIDAENPNRVVFYTETRGRADTLLLNLENATPSTRLRIALEETVETGASPRLNRPFQTIPATEVTLSFSELRDGLLVRELPVDRHIDRITMQVIDPSGPLDQEFEFVDNGDVQAGDYYYVRVKQLNGAHAWSTPIWVGGEPRR